MESTDIESRIAVYSAQERPKRISAKERARTQEAIQHDPQLRRLYAISRELGIKDTETPDYLKYGTLISKFTSLSGQLAGLKDLPGTQHDVDHETYLAEQLFISNISIGPEPNGHDPRNISYENIRLELQFCYNRGALGFIDVLWYTNRCEMPQTEINGEDERHALDPIRVVREDFYHQNGKDPAQIKRLKRLLNYTAHAIELYAGAHQEQTEASHIKTARQERAARRQQRPDKIDKAIAALLSGIRPDFEDGS